MIDKLLGKIRVLFIGDDENLTNTAKEACAGAKAFFTQSFESFTRHLNAYKNFDIVLFEVANAQSFEFIEDMSYENLGSKIIILESQAHKSDKFLSKALDLMSACGSCVNCGGGADICLPCKSYQCQTHKGYAGSL